MKRITDGDMSGAQLRARIDAVLGGRGAIQRLRRAGVTSQQMMHRMGRDDAPAPAYMVAIVELLEALPEDRWPARWHVKSARPVGRPPRETVDHPRPREGCDDDPAR